MDVQGSLNSYTRKKLFSKSVVLDTGNKNTAGKNLSQGIWVIKHKISIGDSSKQFWLQTGGQRESVAKT